MAALFRGRHHHHDDMLRSLAPRTTEQVRQLLRLLPRYRVMLYDDDHNTMDHVVDVLLSTVPVLTPEDAVRIMLEAHTCGRAQVIVCPKEHAEFYCEGLEQHALRSTIEPA